MKRWSRSEPLVEDSNPIRRRRDGYYHAKVHTNGEGIKARTHDQAEQKYWDAAYGGMLGNKKGTSDAEDYRGRGHVQLTGKANYRAMSRRLNPTNFSYEYDGVTYGGDSGNDIDLVAHPTHVNKVPDLSARVLVQGSMDGTFIPPRSLPDYIDQDEEQDPFGEKDDFIDARGVVNSDRRKNGRKIADATSKYAQALVGMWDMVFGDVHMVPVHKKP